MSEIEIRELKKDEYEKWDEIVEKSPYGTIFHSSVWLTTCSNLLNKKLKIYGFFENNQLIGGCSLYLHKKGFLKVASSTCEMTPYGGVVLVEVPDSKVRMREHRNHNIIRSLCDVLDSEGLDRVSLTFSPEFVDVRPFIWNGWDTKVLYTYYLGLDNFENKISRDVKRNINKAIKNEIIIEKSEDIDSFYELFEMTFSRQGLNPPATKRFLAEVFDMVLKNEKGEMWVAQTKSEEIAASEIFVYDRKKVYRWSAATHPELRRTGAYSLLLHKVFQDMQSRGFKEVNLMAANTPQLAEFITGFNPKLVPYYGVEKLNVTYSFIKVLLKSGIMKWMKKI
jgi:hypothetical protein